MLDKYLKYLGENFKKINDEHGVDYVLKVIPESFRKLFDKMCLENNLKWKVENHQIVTINKGLNVEQIDFIKERVNFIKHNYVGPVKYEDIPDWYYTFLSKSNGISIRNLLGIVSNTSEDVLTIKPECLDGLFYIGQYNGIFTVPIFTNKDGNIFAFNAKEFRLYMQMEPNKKNFDKYRKTNVTLIGYWEDIDAFLISETKRLVSIYLEEPTYKALEEKTTPFNINPALLDDLYKKGKIKKT